MIRIRNPHYLASTSGRCRRAGELVKLGKELAPNPTQGTPLGIIATKYAKP
jgi:hypothetical protein